MKYFLYLVLLALISMPGCDCQPPAEGGAETISALTADSSGNKIMTSEMRKKLEENFSFFQFALNDSTFEEHMSYYDPRMFKSETYRLDSMIVRFNREFQKGQVYEVKNVYVTDVSPMVLDSGYYWTVVKTYLQMDIRYTDAYEADPAGFLGMIKDKYGSNVTYEAETRTFHIDDNYVYYATTPEDTIDFKFLYTTFFQVKEFGKLASFNTIRTLKGYE